MMFLLRPIELAPEQAQHSLYSMAGLSGCHDVVERVVIDDCREAVAMPDFCRRPAQPQGGYTAGAGDSGHQRRAQPATAAQLNADERHGALLVCDQWPRMPASQQRIEARILSF